VDQEAARGGAPPDAIVAPPIHLRGGQVILLTGASGAGKSTLLQSLCRKYNRQASWIDIGRIDLPDALVIDAMAEAQGGGDDDDETAIVAALEALSRFGLGEVWSYLRTPAQLSEGQRWRLRLALALASARPAPDKPLTILAADEFAAPLDRVTALVVARALNKAVSARPDLCAIVATTRDDLITALNPDLIVHCDFGTYNIQERGSSWKDQQTTSPRGKSTSSNISSRPRTSKR
jgi:ABC-type ATPase with predicted acetyltransferase domain